MKLSEIYEALRARNHRPDQVTLSREAEAMQITLGELNASHIGREVVIDGMAYRIQAIEHAPLATTIEHDRGIAGWPHQWLGYIQDEDF